MTDLAEKLATVRDELRDEYLQPHLKPWIVGFSGGKDSTLIAHLTIEMLLELPPSKRQRAVHILSNDTLVESPVVQNFVDSVLDRMREGLSHLELPVVVKKTTPDPDATFWVNLIGRGYPAPNRTFRWCTDRMKIRPTTDYIRDQMSQAGEVILLLGVRRLESTNRAKIAKRYDGTGRLNPHNDLKGCFVFRPILEFTTDDVWTSLLQLRPPWGGSHRDLVTLYRNAQGGECPFVVGQTDAPSCGTSSSRFGCWTCTVVEKDRSLQGFIDNGFEHFEPLLGFRDWLKGFSAEHQNRMVERRNGQPGVGPFTMEARKVILQELLSTQRSVELPLISQAEVERIHQIWSEDEVRGVVRKADRILALFDENDERVRSE